MQLKKWNLNDQTDPVSQLLASLVHKQSWLPLLWTEIGSETENVKQVLSQFDLKLVELGENELGFVLPISAWPTFAARVKKWFGDDQHLLSDLKVLEEVTAVYWQAGRFRFNLTKRPLVYGILNVTPDSFYDGGRFNNRTSLNQVAKRPNPVTLLKLNRKRNGAGLFLPLS